MTPTPHPVDTLLAALNPVPVEPVAAPALDERARADLARILASAPVQRDTGVLGRIGGLSRRRRFTLAAVAAVAIALLAVVLVPSVGHQSGAAYAATPTPLVYLPTGEDAPALLAQIAARTAALPDDTGTGRYAHVQIRSWDLSISVDDERVTSTVVPQHLDRWLAADGSGRTVVTASLPGGHQIHEDRATAGGGSSLMWPLHSLSSHDETLAGQLAVGHPVENGPAERIVAIEDAYLQMPIPPAVRAAMLHYLAATPGIVVTGQVTDRAGRHGIGFSLDSAYSGLPTRYTLIIDPDDGRLLGSEDMLTTTAGGLNVPIPSVIGYTVFLSAEYTDTTK